MKQNLPLIILFTFLSLNLYSQEIDSLKKIINSKSSSPSLINDTKSKLAYHYLKKKPDSFAIILSDLKAYNEKHDDKIGKARVKMLEGRVLLRKNKIDSAISLLEIAFKESDTHGDIYGKYKSLHLIGWCYYRRGKFDKALEHYTKSVAISSQTKDFKSITKTYNNIGVVYKKKGDFSKALDYYYKSLKINEETGRAISKSQANLCNNIGTVYYAQGDNKKTIELFEKGLKIRIALKDTAGMSLVYGNIGELKQSSNDTVGILKVLYNAVEYAKVVNNNYSAFFPMLVISNVYMDRNQMDSAFVYNTEAMNIAKKVKAEDLIGAASSMWARYYRLQGDHQKALKYSTEAYNIAKKLDFLTEQNEALKEKYQAEKNLGLHEAALLSHIEHVRIQNSLTEKENLKNSLGKEFKHKEDRIRLEQEKEKIAHQAEMERQELIRNSFIGGFVLIIGLVFVILRAVRQKKMLRLEKAMTAQLEDANDKLKYFLP